MYNKFNTMRLNNVPSECLSHLLSDYHASVRLGFSKYVWDGVGSTSVLALVTMNHDHGL